jgi:hypothetical protein
MLGGLTAYMRRHHLALLALFVALGGTSFAAANLINGSQIKPHSIPKNRLTNSAISALHGAKGVRGAQGPQGAQGQQGATGAAGSPAAGALLGLLNATTDLMDYVNPTWPTGAGTTEDTGAVAISPNATMVARDLSFTTSTAPGGVESRAVTLRVNHADTALGCTMTGTATSCTSGSTVTVPPGSFLSIKVQKSSGAPPGYVYWGFRLTTP